MSTMNRPETETQLAELVSWAAGNGKTLSVAGQGTKRTLGRPVDADHALDMSAFSGIVEYEPGEMYITAQAATPLAEVRAALDAARQQLAFEPIDYHTLLGVAESAGSGTVGGMAACNLAGPRRISAGACRDHLLGVRGIGGGGAVFKAGGKVVKNVTGFDLTKLLAGSYGTLAALTELTLRVLPKAEKTRTVLLLGLDDAQAVQALGQALRSSHEVSAAAHLPREAAVRSNVDLVRSAGTSVTAIRVEGPGPSVEYRCAALHKELAEFGKTEELHSSRSTALWNEVRCAAHLAEPHERVVWRLSVPPSSAAEVVRRIRARMAADALYDWGGGLVWLAVERTPDCGEEVVRGCIAHGQGGHATLIRAPEECRRDLPVFHPQREPLAALTRRLKQNLDPAGVLNPGRMIAGL